MDVLSVDRQRDENKVKITQGLREVALSANWMALCAVIETARTGERRDGHVLVPERVLDLASHVLSEMRKIIQIEKEPSEPPSISC